MANPATVEATVQIIGVNPYVLIGVEQVAIIKPDWRGPMPVVVGINGDEELKWRTNMMPNGKGAFYLYLHREMRKASATKVADTIILRIVFDEQYRNGPLHPMPVWFRNALQTNSSASANWEELIPSRQKEILRYLNRLKSPEAKQRNTDRIITALEGQSTHVMGRDWANGK